MSEIKLKEALLAAADEAGRLQEENETAKYRLNILEERTSEQTCMINQLRAHTQYLEDENRKLRERLSSVGEIVVGLGSLLTEPL